MDPQNNPALDLVSDAMRSFYARSHKLIDRIMRERGVSFAQARVLSQIQQNGPMRSTDLATAFGYAPRTITEAIDGLERDGMVRRDADPDDRRAKRISLTPAGAEAISASEASRLRYIDSVYGVLGAAECEALVTMIGKLNDRLRDLGG